MPRIISSRSPSSVQSNTAAPVHAPNSTTSRELIPNNKSNPAVAPAAAAATRSVFDMSPSQASQPSQSSSLMCTPPSPHFAQILTLLKQLADAIPLTAGQYVRRTQCYHQLFEHLKNTAIGGGGGGGGGTEQQSTPTSTQQQQQQESPSDIEHVVNALPIFYDQLLVDIQRTLTPHTMETIDVAPATASSPLPPSNSSSSSSTPPPPPPTPTPTPAQRDREAMLLARAAMRSLGFFLHHPTYAIHFPLASRDVRLGLASPTPQQAQQVDGMDVLTTLLAHSTDRQLTCMIVWVLAEQCLSGQVLSLYVDQAIDSFVVAVERCQTIHTKPTGSPISASSAASSTSASPCAPLQQEIIHALFKFARFTPASLRTRCMSAKPGNTKGLDWLRVLLLQPYLNPIFYFDAHKNESHAELRRLCLLLLNLCLTSETGSSYILTDYLTNPNVSAFCLACHRSVTEGGWVKQVVDHAKAKMALLDASPKSTPTTTKKPEEEKTTLATATDAPPVVSEYEQKVMALHMEAFTLLNVYLNCLGKVATSMSLPSSSSILQSQATGPTSSPSSVSQLSSTSTSAASASQAAINAFLSFYQPLFNHPLASMRIAVFQVAWKNVCKVLNTEETPITTANAGAITAPSSTIRPTASKLLPLSMKPFAHQLSKEKDPHVVGAILKVWLEIIEENFMTKPAVVSDASATTTITSSSTQPIVHRIHQKSTYDEVISKVLSILLSSKVAFELTNQWDSHMRARMYDEMREGFLWTPANQPSSTPDNPHSKETTMSLPSSHNTTNSSSASASGLTGSLSMALSSQPPAPPLSKLQVIITALLVQSPSSLSRTSFLTSMTQLLSRALTRVAGQGEKKSWMQLYELIMEFAIKQHPKQPIDRSSATEFSSAKGTPDPTSLLQALFRGWQHSASSLASMLLTSPSPATGSSNVVSASPSLTTTAAPLSERQISRLHFACIMQFNTLKAWLNATSLIEALPGVGDLWHDETQLLMHRVGTEKGDLEYNVTPTPCSAPSSLTPHPASTRLSATLLCLLTQWLTTCSCLFTPHAFTVIPTGAHEKLREIVLDGVTTILQQYFNRSSRFMSIAQIISCMQVVLDLLLKKSNDTNLNAATEFRPIALFVWQYLLHTCSLLVEYFVPALFTHQRGDGSQSPRTPSSPLFGGDNDHSMQSTSTPNQMVSSQQAQGGKGSIERFAQILSQSILHPIADLHLGTPQLSSMTENNDELIEFYLSVLMSVLSIPLPSPSSSSSPSSSPSLSLSSASSSPIDWNSSFSKHANRLVQVAMTSSASTATSMVQNDQPDVMSLVVQALNECQKQLMSPSSLSSSSSFDYFLRFTSMLLNALHPSSTQQRFASPASSSNPGNWKQWKTHPDANVQKLVCLVLEQIGTMMAMKRSEIEDTSMTDEITIISNTVATLPSYLPSFFTSLTSLFTRFPHSITCIDGISWFLRLLPGLHSLLSAIDVKLPNSPTTNQQHQQQPLIVNSIIELFNSALTSFRKNYHGEFDFQLLQTVVGKASTAAPNHSSAAGSVIVHSQSIVGANGLNGSALTAKSLLFIDLLTLCMQHSLPSIRSIGVHYWTHTYASKRHGQVPIATMRFITYPNFVAACQALATAGELKSSHMPQLQPPPVTITSPSPNHLQRDPSTGASMPGTPGLCLPSSKSASPSFPRGDNSASPMIHSRDGAEYGDGGDEMNLANMLGGDDNTTAPVGTKAVSPATTASAMNSAPPSAMRTTTLPLASTTPGTTPRVGSFLPANRGVKKTNLLDRLSGLSAYALPPEPVMMAPPSAMTPLAYPVMASHSITSTVSSAASVAVPEPQPPQLQRDPTTSTLSPFPTTPGTALSAPQGLGSGGPVVSPSSSTTAATIQKRPTNEHQLQPRVLQFDVAESAAKQQLQKIAKEVLPKSADTDETESEAKMDESTGAPILRRQATEVTIVEVDETAPLAAAAETSPSVTVQIVVSSPLPPPSSHPDGDIGNASLSLPIGSSISQLPAQVPEEGSQDTDGHQQPQPFVPPRIEVPTLIAASNPVDEPAQVAAVVAAPSSTPPLILPSSHPPSQIHSQPFTTTSALLQSSVSMTSHSEPILPFVSVTTTDVTEAALPLPLPHDEAEVQEIVHEQVANEVAPAEASPPVATTTETVSPQQQPQQHPTTQSLPTSLTLVEAVEIIPEVIQKPDDATNEVGVQEEKQQTEVEHKQAESTAATVVETHVVEIAPTMSEPAPTNTAPPKSRKRALSPAPGTGAAATTTRASSPLSKRVMFNEKRNIEISPSPNFSASASCSLDPVLSPQIEECSVEMKEKAHGDDGDIEMKETEPAAEHEQEESKSNHQESRAAIREARAEKLLAYQNKKAILKAQINPPSNALPPGTLLPSILKPQATNAPVDIDNEEKSMEVQSIYPPLASNLASLTLLNSHFPAPLASAFIDFFQSQHHLVTIGDVASSKLVTLKTHVPLPVRLYIAQQIHADTEDAVTVEKLIVDALAAFERSEKDQQTERKRKHNPDGAETDNANTDTNAVEPSSKRMKLIGPIESLQTTQQQEAWLERMMCDPSASVGVTASEPIAASSASHLSATSYRTPTSAASNSQSQPMSCGSEIANASPLTPFVAPELTSTPREHTAATKHETTSVITPPSSTLKPPRAPAIIKAASDPVSTPHIPLTTTTSIAPATHGTPLSIPTPAISSPSPPTMLSTFVAPASNSMNQIHRPIAMAAPTTASAFVAPTALAAASYTAAVAVQFPLADQGAMDDTKVDGEVVDQDAEMHDSIELEPMSRQMEDVRFHLRSSMAMLFAPVQHSLRPTTPTSTAVAPAATSSSNFNVIQHLNLSQLQELHSCVQTIHISIQQQIGKINKAQQRRANNANAKQTPPTTPPAANRHE